MMSIASKELIEENKIATQIRKQNVLKMIEEKKDKETVNMESLHRLVKSLANEIVNLKKNVAEESTYKKPWRPFTRRNIPPPCNQISSADVDEDEEVEEEGQSYDNEDE
jgi:hypothetical protein